MIALFWGGPNHPTEDFARKLNIELFYINALSQYKLLLWPIRYGLMFLKTWHRLSREKPHVVYVVNTPVFAPLCVYLYCKQQHIQYIMDVHGHSFYGIKWAWARPLQRFLAQHALVNLVDHKPYQQLFDSWHADQILLERPPVEPPGDLEKTGRQSPAEGAVLTYIGNFMDDEPIDVVIDTAKEMPDVQFVLLGDTSKAKKSHLSGAPANVRFPGYLTQETYWQQLKQSNLILVLTTTPHSLTSGGIEAMVLGRPVLLSRQPALTSYFSKGVIFVEHTVESLKKGIREGLQNEKQFAQEIRDLGKEKRDRWHREFDRLIQMIESVGEDNTMDSAD